MRIQRNFKSGVESIQTHVFWCTLLHLPAAPEHCQGTQEGFLGVRGISAHMACPLWPMTFWRICPCRVLLVPWPPQLYSWLAASCLQGPTGSCTEGASGTRRTAPGTGPSVKGHIRLLAQRALGRHQEEMHSLDFTQVKENSLQFSFLLKITWNLFPTHLVILKHDLKTKQNTYITFPNVFLHLVISKQICYIERVLKIQFSILQTLVIHEESLSYNNIPNIKIQRSTCKPKYSSELSSQNLVFSRNVGKEAALTVRKEIKTHTCHVCLLVNWENTKNNWFLVDFLFFNPNKSRLQIHPLKSHLYNNWQPQSAPAFTTQPGSSRPLYRRPEMTFNAERKINNPARTKHFKSNNFNLGDICSLKLIFLKYFNKKWKKKCISSRDFRTLAITITLETRPQPVYTLTFREPWGFKSSITRSQVRLFSS